MKHTYNTTINSIPCWLNSRAAMLRSFYKNSGSLQALDVPMRQKVILLNRATLPVLAYRAARWPPSTSVISTVDRFQRRLLASCLATQPLPAEPPLEFFKRRNAIVTANLPTRLKRSQSWCHKSIKWDEHIARRHGMTWSADLLACPKPLKVSRAHSGRPTTRWAEGVTTARAIVG